MYNGIRRLLMAAALIVAALGATTIGPTVADAACNPGSANDGVSWGKGQVTSRNSTGGFTACISDIQTDGYCVGLEVRDSTGKWWKNETHWVDCGGSALTAAGDLPGGSIRGARIYRVGAPWWDTHAWIAWYY